MRRALEKIESLFKPKNRSTDEGEQATGDKQEVLKCEEQKDCHCKSDSDDDSMPGLTDSESQDENEIPTRRSSESMAPEKQLQFVEALRKVMSLPRNTSENMSAEELQQQALAALAAHQTTIEIAALHDRELQHCDSGNSEVQSMSAAELRRYLVAEEEAYRHADKQISEKLLQFADDYVKSPKFQESEADFLMESLTHAARLQTYIRNTDRLRQLEEREKQIEEQIRDAEHAELDVTQSSVDSDDESCDDSASDEEECEEQKEEENNDEGNGSDEESDNGSLPELEAIRTKEEIMINQLIAAQRLREIARPTCGVSQTLEQAIWDFSRNQELLNTGENTQEDHSDNKTVHIEKNLEEEKYLDDDSIYDDMPGLEPLSDNDSIYDDMPALEERTDSEKEKQRFTTVANGLWLRFGAEQGLDLKDDDDSDWEIVENLEKDIQQLMLVR